MKSCRMGRCSVCSSVCWFPPPGYPAWPEAQSARPEAQPARPDTQPAKPEVQPARPEAQPAKSEGQASQPKGSSLAVWPWRGMDGRTDGWMEGWPDEQMSRKSLHSPGLGPISGPLPYSRPSPQEYQENTKKYANLAKNCLNCQYWLDNHLYLFYQFIHMIIISIEDWTRIFRFIHVSL